MHPTVLKAYEEEGYSIHVGNSFCYPSALVEKGRLVSVGGGMCVQDLAFALFLSSLIKPKSIYMIGNAFGYSALNYAAIFEGALIDVIDAEVEGDENALGSQITKNISAKYFPHLTLFKGFSPQDIGTCRSSPSQKYDMAIIDGYHHPDQAEIDFIGMLPHLNKEAIVYYHDAGLFSLTPRLEKIAKEYAGEGWQLFKLDFIPFGGCVLLKGFPSVSEWLSRLSTPIDMWRNPAPTDRVSARPKSLKAVKFGQRIYYPHEGDIVFCGDMNANLVRLVLDMNPAGQIAFYGAQGKMAESLIDFISNYRDRNIVFIDKALAGKTVDGWKVYCADDINVSIYPSAIVISAANSGLEIRNLLLNKKLEAPIYPLFDHSDSNWETLKSQYLTTALEKWK